MTSRPDVVSTLPAPDYASRPHTLHGRIREELRERIVSGTLRLHERVPSESELMKHYGVSRITVRQALADLERERLIFKVAGKGSFVAQAKPFQELGRLQGFAEAMGALGHETFNRVLSLKTVPASAEVATRLALTEGTRVTEIRRVRHLDRAPVSLDVTWVPLSIGERLAREDLQTRDIFLLLENQCGLPLGHADLAIGADVADEEVARQLKVVRGAPILRIERLTCTTDGTPIDYEQLYCRSDNFQYRLRLLRKP
ncbi:MAG: GntR family transcriptional regulator [Polyangiales bacterium]